MILDSTSDFLGVWNTKSQQVIDNKFIFGSSSKLEGDDVRITFLGSYFEDGG